MLNPNEFVTQSLTKLYSYLLEVETGIGIGEFERLAVDRFFEFKTKYEFKERELIEVLRFFSLLHLAHNDKVSQIQLLPVNVFWLAAILCFYYPGTDNRVVDQVYITIAKKNGKTSLFACLILYLCRIQHLNSHIVVLAADTKQAKTSLDIIKNIITNTPGIEKYVPN